MTGIKRLLAALCFVLLPLVSHAEVIDGNPDGKLTLIEFYDYQCSHCRHMADVVDLLIDKNPDLKVVYRIIPVLGSNSWYAARAIVAARAQGKFEAFHDALVAQKSSITPQVVHRVAEQVGLDLPKLKAAMESDVVTKEINNNLALSRSLNVRSIPTIVIKSSHAKTEGQRFTGTTSYLHLQEALAKLRANTR